MVKSNCHTPGSLKPDDPSRLIIKKLNIKLSKDTKESQYGKSFF